MGRWQTEPAPPPSHEPQKPPEPTGHERTISYTQRHTHYFSSNDIDKEPPNHLLHAALLLYLNTRCDISSRLRNAEVGGSIPPRRKRGLFFWFAAVPFHALPFPLMRWPHPSPAGPGRSSRLRTPPFAPRPTGPPTCHTQVQRRRVTKQPPATLDDAAAAAAAGTRAGTPAEGAGGGDDDAQSAASWTSWCAL